MMKMWSISPLISRRVGGSLKRLKLVNRSNVRSPVNSVNISAQGQSAGNILAANAVILVTTAAVVSTTKSRCDRGPSQNPLWPEGVSKDDVNQFVNSILNDRSMNISGIPDVLERQIYVTTVTLTANVLYKALSQIHDVQLFGHKFELLRRANTKLIGTGKNYVGVDEGILEQVADRLLANSSINQELLPDFLERQIYVNCLKLIFHLLDTVAASFCITICGHDVRVHFEPTTKSIKPISSRTRVDMEELVKYAKQELGEDLGLYEELHAKLTGSLYGLILGIVDDMLANTDVEVLSDSLGIDIVPLTGIDKIRGAQQKHTLPLPKENEGINPGKNSQMMLASFGLGIGVGAIAMMMTSRS